jgi:hypothetical protein
MEIIFIDKFMINFDSIIIFTHKWQTLIGAFVGTMAPITFTVGMFSYKNKKVSIMNYGNIRWGR